MQASVETAQAPQPGTVEHWARARPDALAAIEGERALSWAALDDHANRLAHALSARGLGRGDIVVVRTQIRLEWMAIAAACGKLGCSLLGMNWRLTPAEVRYVLNNSRANAIVCDDADPAALLPAFDGQPLKAAVSLDVAAAGFDHYADLVAAPAPARYSAGQPGLIIYTSGTTGLPKGVLMRGSADMSDPIVTEYLADVGAHRTTSAEACFLLTMPVHHGSGPSQIWAAQKAGALTVMIRRYDPLAVLDAIQRYRVSHWTGVPTMFKRLAALPPGTVAQHDLTSLQSITVGAAPVSDALKQWIITHLGDCLYEGYGSTETGMVSRMMAGDQRRKPGSSGRPYRHVRIEIRDADGQVLPAGQSGEIWAWTPVAIRNYLNAPALGTDTRDERGFFRTGDVGRLDDEGFLYISDRAKDMIISGGVNIYPAEIEAALQTHPAVADAAVIGIPDEEFGESVMAFCEIKPGLSVDEPALLEHCVGQLASYKRPRNIRIVDELPRNTVGKLLKRDLRAPFWKDKEKNV
ncbi:MULTISPECIES: class I adenylate-forming enzyme family protein [Cupriavidus]|uniref:Long-chain fatty acid--CoA ligase n=1 Tax=Cupriavidus taiwanensis TaxID=164546 RepID=A0A375D2Q8_9BURK|nr:MULTISPECIES: AMP-binding protein [Cupriavidus]MEC3764525.1 AMP-binding protein [Cupriavidus sp. SS-3]SOY92724.1 Non-specific protein-tyrosine kinase [Cupriavidus taiwanensis]SOY97084.1 Non-specific protein-tyrosine kinase [Cupriavidus taiwanensis]SPD68528.1 Long-chain fatty acid--CoA ligase [Cupriavidus taiwanensis]